MMKRSMESVFAAIGAAMAETQGRALDQIDAAGDAAWAAARRQVSVTLQDYAPFPGAEPGQAEWQYRLELERVLQGPAGVVAALAAWMQVSEGDDAGTGAGDTRTTEAHALAQSWVDACQSARARGMRGLADSHSAWFEVRAVRTISPSISLPLSSLPGRSPPAQAELFGLDSS